MPRKKVMQAALLRIQAPGSLSFTQRGFLPGEFWPAAKGFFIIQGEYGHD